MHDKLDFIWDKDNETKIVDHMQVKKQLRLRKIDREFQNAQQAKVYTNLQNSLSLRKVKPTTESENECPQSVHESERLFMDAFKAMIESGYALTEVDFLSLLDVLQVQKKVVSVHQLEKTTAFFVQAATMMHFSAEKVIERLTRNWVHEESKEHLEPNQSDLESVQSSSRVTEFDSILI